MSTVYPSELAVLQANAGNPVQLERIQNAALVAALKEMGNTISTQTLELTKMREMLTRRTAVFTPARGFSSSVYQRNGTSSSGPRILHI
jgi:hypothetical protein